MRLTSPQLETLRTRPTSTELDLFIFNPAIVMACQVNDANAAKGLRSIAFDSATTGTISAIEPGMTLLIGTQPGYSDIGKARLKGATGSFFYVGENSNVEWRDNQYLTVLRYWDIWPVFPRMIQDPNNAEAVIWYKDYDNLYVNQNFNLGTFVNIGGHRPVFLENGTGSIYYTSTGSLNLLGNALTYNWAFEGGNPTGATSATPGRVYYTTPGDYVTRLIVTDTATGQQDKTYRYVSVKNKIGQGRTTPITRWTMGSLSGSRDEGGYKVSIRTYNAGVDIDYHSIVMLKATDYYGSQQVSLGGNFPGAEDVFFVGYIEAGSIRYNARESYIEFTAISITDMMKKATGFSVSVESKENPANWYELRDMDIRRALYHYLRYHTTVLSVADFTFLGTDQKIQFYDVDRTSIFDGVDNLAKSALLGRLQADRQGRLFVDVDPLAYPYPTGSFVPVMGLVNRDWKNEPSIQERVYDDVSYIEMGGIAYSGAITGTFAALLSGAPGSAPSYHGSVEKISGLALTDQTQLNQLSGNLWANKNQPYPSISMEMATPPRNLDITPQEVVSLDLLSTDTIRNKRIVGLYIPNTISWNYSPENKYLSASMEFIGLVNGTPGDTIIIPDTVSNADFEFPSFSFPVLPNFYLPALPIIPPLETQNLVIHVKDKGIFYTNDFQSDYPSWQSATVNLPLPYSSFRNFEVDAGGRLYLQFDYSSIWFASSPGATWNKFFDYTQIDNPQSFPFPRNQEITGFGINRDTGAVLAIAGPTVTIGSNNLLYSWYGSGAGLARTNSISFIAQGGNRRGYVTFHNGKWVLTYSNDASGNKVSVAVLSLNGSALLSSITAIADSSSASSFVHTRSRYNNGVLALKETVTSNVFARLSLDDGSSLTSITGTSRAFDESLSTDRFESIITNESGSQIVVASNVLSMGLVVSLDSGVSWTSGTFRSSGTTSVWHLGSNTYVYAANNGIRLVPDITANSLSPTGTIDKTGNLANIITGTFQVIAIRHY